MRVVLDTNILISACWKPDGLEHRTCRLAWEGKLHACVTSAVWNEYLEVLGRKKFQPRRSAIEGLLSRFGQCVQWIDADGITVAAATDEADNRFLECAEAAQAEYLVTGNSRDYPQLWKGTRIANARAFLNDCGYEAPA